MEFFAETSNWLLISFVIFAVILWRAAKGAVIRMLDGRIETIREELQTAENLRVEAQELLAQYQRKHRDAVKDAENIVNKAERHAEEIRRKAEADLKETMERREKQLKERLVRMEQSAIAEIQKYAADLAIEATAEIIANKLDKKSNEKLVDQSIKDIGKNLH